MERLLVADTTRGVAGLARVATLKSSTANPRGLYLPDAGVSKEDAGARLKDAGAKKVVSALSTAGAKTLGNRLPQENWQGHGAGKGNTAYSLHIAHNWHVWERGDRSTIRHGDEIKQPADKGLMFAPWADVLGYNPDQPREPDGKFGEGGGGGEGDKPAEGKGGESAKIAPNRPLTKEERKEDREIGKARDRETGRIATQERDLEKERYRTDKLRERADRADTRQEDREVREMGSRQDREFADQEARHDKELEEFDAAHNPDDPDHGERRKEIDTRQEREQNALIDRHVAEEEAIDKRWRDKEDKNRKDRHAEDKAFDGREAALQEERRQMRERWDKEDQEIDRKRFGPAQAGGAGHPQTQTPLDIPPTIVLG